MTAPDCLCIQVMGMGEVVMERHPLCPVHGDQRDTSIDRPPMCELCKMFQCDKAATHYVKNDGQVKRWDNPTPKPLDFEFGPYCRPHANVASWAEPPAYDPFALGFAAGLSFGLLLSVTVMLAGALL